jgi:hypothetical protein
MATPALAQPAPRKAHRFKKDTDAPSVSAPQQAQQAAAVSEEGGGAGRGVPSRRRPSVKVFKRGGRTVYQLPTGVIYGKVHEPQAVLMMNRKQDLFRLATPKKGLTSRILDPVRRRPF